MKDLILKHGIWIYRAFVIVLCVYMLLSFILPWWSADLSVIKEPDAIRIYSWGLRHDLNQYHQYIAQDETPLYHTVLAWGYMALSLALLSLSARLKGKKEAVLTTVVGLGYLAYCLTALFAVIAPRLEDSGLILQGQVVKTVIIKSILISSRLHDGYYLACSAAALCLILGLLRFFYSTKYQKKHSPGIMRPNSLDG